MMWIPFWFRVSCFGIPASSMNDAVFPASPVLDVTAVCASVAGLREDFDKRERQLFGGESFTRFVDRAAAIEAELGIGALASYTEGISSPR
jgi:hypothetical protein